MVYTSDAALLLEQAAGRLIRRTTDTGMLVVLDPRLLRSSGPRRPQYHAITQRGGTITVHGPLDAPMPYPGNASGALVWSHVQLAGCDQYRPALEVSRP